jgi:hypothetical protein
MGSTQGRPLSGVQWAEGWRTMLRSAFWGLPGVRHAAWGRQQEGTGWDIGRGAENKKK